LTGKEAENPSAAVAIAVFTSVGYAAAGSIIAGIAAATPVQDWNLCHHGSQY
jgi:heme A synthase